MDFLVEPVNNRAIIYDEACSPFGICLCDSFAI